MTPYRDALNRVIEQLQEATLPDGTKTFAEVSLGKARGELFPCVTLSVSDATSLRIRALILVENVTDTESAILACAESACKALGFHGLKGSFDWIVERGTLYRIWTCRYEVF